MANWRTSYLCIRYVSVLRSCMHVSNYMSQFICVYLCVCSMCTSVFMYHAKFVTEHSTIKGSTCFKLGWQPHKIFISKYLLVQCHLYYYTKDVI